MLKFPLSVLVLRFIISYMLLFVINNNMYKVSIPYYFNASKELTIKIEIRKGDIESYSVNDFCSFFMENPAQEFIPV